MESNISRSELINWINNFSNVSLQKIEQLGTGVVFCKIMETIHPDKIKMSQVFQNPKNEFEFEKNFKVLQNCFENLNMNKTLQIEKIVKKRFQDNFELAQWIYHYFKNNYSIINKTQTEFSPTVQKNSIKTEQSVKIQKLILKDNQTQSLSPQIKNKKEESIEKYSLNYKRKKPQTMTHKKYKNSHDMFINQFDWTFKVKSQIKQDQIFKQQKEFYQKKIFDIENVIQNFQGNSVEDLINSIRFSLYSINEKNDDSEDSELKYSKNLKISQYDQSLDIFY